MEEKQLSCLKGRRKIYTDVEKITEENIFDVLRDAMLVHNMNRDDMQFLLNFEKGNQPLVREKAVRKDIDIKSISNLANEITEFKLGYFWGNPIAIVQKSDKLPKGSDPEKDNSAISILNSMYASEFKDSKDQKLARYIEICGIGYQMIDVKRNAEESESAFDLLNLNPLYTFIVYSNNVYETPMLGVTYVENNNGEKFFSCYSKDCVFFVSNMYKVLKNGKQSKKMDWLFGARSGESNPLEEVPIIEFQRSFDRTGCFERQVDELNALNVLESDLVNDVAQTTQANWWGNDFEFDTDDNGNPKAPVGGQWIMTKTKGNGNKPDIKALVLQYDYDGVLSNINSKHDAILERAYVPKQSDPGGGSTGTAMSLSSGWSATESVACKEALVVKESFQRRNKLALKAIHKSSIVPEDSPLQTLVWSDIDIRFIRQKTFDLATKCNALSTLINCMVDPKTAMSTVDLFSNLAEAIDDSVDNMKKLQQNMIENGQKDKSEIETGNDLSAQTENSPILDN